MESLTGQANATKGRGLSRERKMAKTFTSTSMENVFEYKKRTDTFTAEIT